MFVFFLNRNAQNGNFYPTETECRAVLLSEHFYLSSWMWPECLVGTKTDLCCWKLFSCNSNVWVYFKFSSSSSSSRASDRPPSNILGMLYFLLWYKQRRFSLSNRTTGCTSRWVTQWKHSQVAETVWDYVQSLHIDSVEFYNVICVPERAERIKQWRFCDCNYRP